MKLTVQPPVPDFAKREKVSTADETASGEPALVDEKESINDLKKQLKRVSNKRAIHIAARMGTGESQDALLKEYESKLNKVELDLAKWKAAFQRGETSVPSASSAKNDATKESQASQSRKSIPLESLITRLELERTHIKDKVRTFFLAVALGAVTLSVLLDSLITQ
jgi:hypothetical protein